MQPIVGRHDHVDTVLVLEGEVEFTTSAAF